MNMNSTKMFDNYDNPTIAEQVWKILAEIVACVSSIYAVVSLVKKWKRSNWAILLFSNPNAFRTRYEKLTREELGSITQTDTSTEIELDDRVYHLKRKKVVDETKEETKTDNDV